MTHVVYTRSRSGNATIFVNGRRDRRREVKGSLGNWDAGFALALAGEVSGGRDWLGTYHLVAIYSRDLSAAEIKRNFDAGHLAEQPSPAPTATQLAEDEGRVKAGLQVLYDFREPDGNLVRDQAGVGDPIDLQIKQIHHVRRTEGAMRITGDNVIRSRQPARRLIDSIKRSQSLSIEAWVRPIGLTQKGPARIVTLSATATERNVTMGQEGDHVEARLRTTKTSDNGLPSISTARATLSEKLTHIVYTRDRQGAARLYLNGKQSEQGHVGGDLSNWENDYRLALADELTGDRGWRGDYHLVADVQPRSVGRGGEAELRRRAAGTNAAKSGRQYPRGSLRDRDRPDPLQPLPGVSRFGVPRRRVGSLSPHSCAGRWRLRSDHRAQQRG